MQALSFEGEQPMREEESATTNVVVFPAVAAEEEHTQEVRPTAESINDQVASFLRRQGLIERLVSRIVNYDEDDEILALTALIHMIAHEKEFTLRDEIASIAMTKAYTFTIDFSVRSHAFQDKALRLRNKAPGPK
jgi:hypothetical protein